MTQPSTITPASSAPARSRNHTVAFYDADATLVSSIVDFLFPSTAAEGVAILIANAPHRDGVRTGMAASGTDVEGAVADGRLVVLDAAETMARFVFDDGTIDIPALHETIGGVLDAAEAAGGAVRVYGEMVSVLWEQGRIATAMHLEQLWNDLGRSRTFALLCGYPSALFAHPGSAQDVDGICGHHTDVVLAPSQYAAEGPPQGSRGPVQWALPAALTSGAAARERLRDLLSAWRLDAVLGVAELLTTELVNNAVVHAMSDVTVHVAHRGELLRVEVSDRGGGVPQRRDSGLEATSGRGLMLVEALSSAWGTGAHGGRKTVWFELPTGDAAL
ncbi:MAG TPA: MEDS domain-containing protein [Euzebya sp.]|nr:MEDS domain-containing protein [Euzebya sp.]